MKQELSETRRKNRQRTEPVRGFDHGSTIRVPGGAKSESQAPNGLVDKKLFCESEKEAYQFEPHAPTREERAPALYYLNAPEISARSPGTPTTATYFGQMPMTGNVNQNATQWLMPNGMIDARPEFTGGLFRNWCREAKLRRQAQVGTNPTQLISKIAALPPINSRMEAPRI